MANQPWSFHFRHEGERRESVRVSFLGRAHWHPCLELHARAVTELKRISECAGLPSTLAIGRA
ncbi:MAG: hypothetical protein P8P49_01165 [Opitutales bacterium]|nr:hypothetical protein [Opitutales bacterium]